MRSPAETAVFLAQIAERIGGLLDSIGANHDGLATAAPLDGVERLLIERYLDRRAARFPVATKNRPPAGDWPPGRRRLRCSWGRMETGSPAAPCNTGCCAPFAAPASTPTRARGALEHVLRHTRPLRRTGTPGISGRLPVELTRFEAQLLGHCDGTLVRRLALRLVEHLRLLTVEINELTAEITVRVRTHWLRRC
jgi:hypothetical protein